jgi:protease-4
MTQYGSTPPSNPYPTPSPYAPPSSPAPKPQIVHIVAKPGGFWRAFSFVIGLGLIAAVFIVGIGVGLMVFATQSTIGDVVIRQTYREGNNNKIAIIPVTGGIDAEQAEWVHAAVNNVLDDRSVYGVILRVDSPGGAVAPSDQIWNEVNRLKERNVPVVASFGGVAASGGYYVACGTDHIVAEETCITGSIGVIAQVMTLEGLLGKVGIQPVTLVASGSPQKDTANDIFRAWTDKDKATVRMILDSAYEIFNQRVRDGRKHAISDPIRIDELANGSIFTARQAKDNGLVDAIGYLDDAIAQVEQLARLSSGNATVVMLRRPRSFFGGDLLAQSGSSADLLDSERIQSLIGELGTPRAMYLMR